VAVFGAGSPVADEGLRVFLDDAQSTATISGNGPTRTEGSASTIGGLLGISGPAVVFDPGGKDCVLGLELG
jgi:hypothetical protein